MSHPIRKPLTCGFACARHPKCDFPTTVLGDCCETALNPDGAEGHLSWQTLVVERRRMIPGPEGQPVPATEVGFRALGEHWNEYLLDDGSVVKLKLIVTCVNRAEGIADPKGQPVYVVESTNVMSVSAPASEGSGE